MKHRPRKRFGQNFLQSSGVIDDIIAAVAPQTGDVVVEIGPGMAALTEPLAQYDVELHAIELDRDLASALRKRFASRKNVSIHGADALTFDFAGFGRNLRIVGNLPYNISTPLMFHLVDHKAAISDLHLMLQKEVVDRMVATPGGKNYGRLTIMLASDMEMLPLFDVPPHAFSPPPKVTSAVVRMRPLADARWHIADRKCLSTIVSVAFSKRRKTLHNALKGVADDDLLESLGIDPGLRPEQLPVSSWISLANRIFDSRPREN